MPRRGRIAKREVLPDPLYGSQLVTKLINNVMYDGKKGVAQTIVYDAFAIVEKKLGQNPLDMFQEALENVMPVLEVKARIKTIMRRASGNVHAPEIYDVSTTSPQNVIG